ncbi:MAG: MarR family transcriptional regulator [Robiginitomaculum sp.]|nr:MAG: MarR family transcriptional regulator [Robiginitomaculum sp.]
MYQVLTEIGIIHQLASTALRKALPKPLTLAQFYVLTHLSRVPDVNTPTRITKAFQVTKGAMTHTLGLLQKNGFVSVNADRNDGRAKHVYITDAGRNILAEALKNSTPHFLALNEKFDDDEIQAMTDSLTKIRKFLDKARD